MGEIMPNFVRSTKSSTFRHSRLSEEERGIKDYARQFGGSGAVKIGRANSANLAEKKPSSPTTDLMAEGRPKREEGRDRRGGVLAAPLIGELKTGIIFSGRCNIHISGLLGGGRKARRPARPRSKFLSSWRQICIEWGERM